MQQRFGYLLFAVLGLILSITAHAKTCYQPNIYQVGASKYDITGPAAEDGMMGYGMVNQKTAGIYQRLWARAFVIESPCNGKQVAIVIADLGQVFQGVKIKVIKELKKRFGDTFDDDNVLLAATHTHSGPGGYSTDFFYNITTFGFDPNNFKVVVDGIVNSIDQAYQNKQAAKIKFAKGELTGLNHNRSPQAYSQNPIKERTGYKNNTDETMSLLVFEALDGKAIGVLNWFPIHGTSMNNKNQYINGDNKGYAAYLFEKEYADQSKPFIAAFAQAHAGDVTPNPNHHEGGNGEAGLRAIEKAGAPQFEKALALFKSADKELSGDIDYRHRFYAFNHIAVSPGFTHENAHRTCSASIGLSMLAGTEDGEGFGNQGVTCDHAKQFLPWLLCEATSSYCQGVKPIILNTGDKWPNSWTPQNLPLQIIKIGQFAIAAVPFEPTTMSGRRIINTLKAKLSAANVSEVVVSGLANAYAGYVATAEEYKIQRYEGASTHFGPWTLAAIQQSFAELGQAMLQGSQLDKGPLPPDQSEEELIHLQSGVVMDSKPYNKNFGGVEQDVKPGYQPGDIVEVTFWTGHPKNNFHTGGSYLEVQCKQNGRWQTIRTDNDWDTAYHWQREGMDYSLAKITWKIPKGITKGQYRIAHHGDWKAFWTREVTPFTGYSSTFSIR